MTEITARLIAQAALTSAPDTLVSAEEVSLLLGLKPGYAVEHTPESAKAGRATWSAWRMALGFDEPDEDDSDIIPKSERPLTTWNAVARVVGVSHDTLQRRRRAVGDNTPPRFPNREAVRVWWEALHSPAPTQSRTKPKPKAQGLTLADVRAAQKQRK